MVILRRRLRQNLQAGLGLLGFEILLWAAVPLRSNHNWMTLTLAAFTLILVWCYLSPALLKFGIALVLLASVYLAKSEVSLDLRNSLDEAGHDQRYRTLDPRAHHRFRFRLWNVQERARTCGAWTETALYIIGSHLESARVKSDDPSIRVLGTRLLETGAYVEQPTRRLEVRLEVAPFTTDFELDLDLSGCRSPQIALGPQVVGSHVHPEAIYFLARNAACWVVAYGSRTNPDLSAASRVPRRHSTAPTSRRASHR